MKSKLRAFTLPILLAMCSTLATPKKPPTPEPKECKAYFMVAEKDAEVTLNLTMVGLSRPQSKWFRKHGREYSNLCLVNGDPSGNRVELNSASQSYVDSVVGGAPLFLIAWEEHRVFVRDEEGGHYAWSANGVLSRWDYGKKDFVPVMPLHNTNRTILTSSSTSLLKDGLKAIEVKQQAGDLIAHPSPAGGTPNAFR